MTEIVKVAINASVSYVSYNLQPLLLSQAFCGIFSGILWHFVAFCGILWHFVAFCAFCGILWHFVAFCGILGILWHFVAFLVALSLKTLPL
jgi:hypothetical protein